MNRLRNPSPCCNVRSVVRVISIETNEMVFRCSKCGQLRIDPLKKKPAPPHHLRLVVSN